MSRVYLSLGSNVCRSQNLRRALAALREHFGELTESPVYESAAEGFEGAPFYNMVVAFDTAKPLSVVLAALRDIELAAGRERGAKRCAPRTLDLDVLLFGDLSGEHDGVQLPRPDILRYAFVLRPLADIAPASRHPLAQLTYAELWRRFDGRRALREVGLQASPQG